MKRYHEEKHILEKRMRKFKQLSGWLNDTFNQYVPVIGRFRKALRCAGCTRARCQLCHSDKYPKRIVTRQERQAQQELREPYE